ncbi:hypothetical protein KJ910_00345 [Patescibacteria group bacterium]|nr:hypothetical protein [Patescibacteria group bacterium]MBU1906633.1 hypothetical protein [Patescibacteria group bacterium]
MSYQPKLKFKTNQYLDQQMAWYFFQHQKHGGVNFWHGRAVKLHPDLKKNVSLPQPKKHLNQYIAALYTEHSNEFEKRTQEIETLYRTKEKLYLRTIDQLFMGYSWPKGEYICFSSIFDFGPRILDDKTFQVFMYLDDKMTLYSIFHEMTHFMFYHYTNTKYPKIFNKLNTEKGLYWDLAETFNTVMHGTRPFIQIHGIIKEPYYPTHKKIVPELKKYWQQNSNLDDYIMYALDVLK